MILRDGTDTRDEVSRPGPFCDGMAVVLSAIHLDGFADSQDGNEGDGSGAARVGKRVLWWDSQGFCSSDRFATADEADEAIAAAFPFDEVHAYHHAGCTCGHCL